MEPVCSSLPLLLLPDMRSESGGRTHRRTDSKEKRGREAERETERKKEKSEISCTNSKEQREQKLQFRVSKQVVLGSLLWQMEQQVI